jgi:hypothetical protein
MIHAIPPSPSASSEEASDSASQNPALQNPAVAHCHQVWNSAFTRIHKTERNQFIAANRAGELFRAAMPPLSGHQNIVDFVACVGFGMAIGAIKDKIGSKLLYAAQIALIALPKPPKNPK